VALIYKSDRVATVRFESGPAQCRVIAVSRDPVCDVEGQIRANGHGE